METPFPNNSSSEDITTSEEISCASTGTGLQSKKLIYIKEKKSYYPCD